MSTLVQTLLRRATRKDDEPLNILTFPTHERYQTGLAETGHNFYMWQGKNIKPWETKYAPIPKGHVLLNASTGGSQVPNHVDIDLVLSQNKFGQFQVAEQIAEQIRCPMVSLEHTLPMADWNKAQLTQLRYMRGDINLFISEYSRDKWGWGEDDADVVHHGVDTLLFQPDIEDGGTDRENVVLSVVNDWINRDWCCGFKIWDSITHWSTDTDLPIVVLGDTPGLSTPATSTQELVNTYRSSRIFLNTSTVSPVPTALLEAMSCGCAVVTTATCMIPEIVDNGVNGFISNDPKELRGYVDRLLEDKELATKLGMAARETIISNFSQNAFIKKWNEVFKQCVS
jgi:glycosyltransferase involved in cell wall biosynthesis